MTPAILLASALALLPGACARAPGPGEAEAPVASAPAAPAAPAARWDGYGPATFGMEADDVRAAWDGDLGSGVEQDASCFHLSPTSQPDQAYFAMMFGDGRFVRYSSSNDAMTAPGGGRRGMSVGAIEALYPGGVDRSPHKYTDGEYLRIAGDGGRVLVFETDDAGVVTEWRVGIEPYVDYVEGCS
jgi:hypothetical protein